LIEFETEVLEIIQRTPDVKSFRFKIKEEINFKPGQFFWVTVKVEGQDKEKPFSFSNSPTEKDYVEFTKRITESEYSQALERLKVGDWAKLRMPFGAFTFEGEYKKIAFLSAGVGITPVRSICKFVTDKGLSTDIVLLYGNRTEKDIIFKDDFEAMQRANKNIRVVNILTSSAIDKTIWCGRIGHIDQKTVKEEITDYQQRVFYLCGPPQMVECMVDILKNNLGIAENKIRREKFAGY